MLGPEAISAIRVVEENARVAIGSPFVAQIVIKSRFNGPPDSGNGGYVCGVVASAVEGPSIVTLRKPPPPGRANNDGMAAKGESSGPEAPSLTRTGTPAR